MDSYVLCDTCLLYKNCDYIKKGSVNANNCDEYVETERKDESKTNKRGDNYE